MLVSKQAQRSRHCRLLGNLGENPRLQDVVVRLCRQHARHLGGVGSGRRGFRGRRLRRRDLPRLLEGLRTRAASGFRVQRHPTRRGVTRDREQQRLENWRRGCCGPVVVCSLQQTGQLSSRLTCVGSSRVKQQKLRRHLGESRLQPLPPLLCFRRRPPGRLRRRFLCSPRCSLRDRVYEV